MNESLKSVAVLVFAVSVIAAAFAWFSNEPQGPTTTVWAIRFAAPAIAVLTLAAILKLQFRRDRAPNYLGVMFGNAFFNHHGLCFSLSTSWVQGVCYFQVHFQNQYEHASIGQVALRPAPGLLGLRAKIEPLAFEFPCAEGAFGVVRLPVALAKKLQGTRQKFEVGASVSYPDGKGRQLRFADGIFVRTNIDFVQIMSRPPTAQILLPIDVAEEIPDDLEPVVQTLWKLGDPPLKIQ